jgi:D-alanine-D-alanine ligase-like ATP-grasp enzyme
LRGAHEAHVNGGSPVAVMIEPWRAHPLAWIHRGEARAIADELRRAGHTVSEARFGAGAVADLLPGPLLLRLSDPVMQAAAVALGRAGVSYLGPGAAVMARCYDKWVAYSVATAAGVDCPATCLASDVAGISFPLVVKPRWGSDSLGMRLVRSGPIPPGARSAGFVAQERIVGAELTIAVISDCVGMPLRLDLPPGTLYTFARKYLLRPQRAPLADEALVEQVRRLAAEIASVFAIDWAARIDLIHERATGRLRFLECDVAPLVGPASAFAASLSAAGIARGEQLELLLRTH